MKKRAFVVIAGLLAFAYQYPVFSQDKNGPDFKFEKTTHDFGDIHQGDKVEHIFTFTNSGNEPLIISNVLTTCGCTAPSYPKEPVKPGESADIKIDFNSTGKMGKQNKIITILSNAVNQKTQLSITANVLPKS